MASGGQSKRRKSYDLKFKLDAVNFAEMNSNEKAAKKFQVSQEICRPDGITFCEINGKLMTWRVLIEAGSRIVKMCNCLITEDSCRSQLQTGHQNFWSETVFADFL